MNRHDPAPDRIVARALTVTGRVQGVGFRPFVFRIAQRFGLAGFVLNRSGQVDIHVEGPPAALEAFEAALLAEAPPLARPELSARAATQVMACDGFTIRPSDAAAAADIHLPPDLFCCDDCLAEMSDPAQRRYRYPFTNCTQCGPRFSIIRDMPYDRASTAMAGFALCDACRAEFENPLDRRFHAQPLACPDCGPVLRFVQDGQRRVGNEEALQHAVALLRAGGILAVKGVGGYHLMCDAGNDAAVQRLRARKRRPDKPLAVMFPQSGPEGLAALEPHVTPDTEERATIRSAERPIVLVPRRIDSTLSPQLAPGLDTLGVFLPYSPLHHLILSDFGAPLVATSGNISGEPVIIDPDEAETGLAGVADAFVHHDRPILRPVDDSVVRVIGGVARRLRVGRGLAPLELALPESADKPVIATGGHMKGAVALGWQGRAVLSPHIGELDSPRALSVFADALTDLTTIHRVDPRRVLCDANPAYAGTRWARAGALPVAPVTHHVAHASALAGERPEVGDWLTFAWDGVGLGPDGTLWGGEALAGAPGRWRRVASFRPFRLLAPDVAAREPWRSAAALMWDAGQDYTPGRDGAALARQAWGRGVGVFETSSAGRLFDAAAALVLGVEAVSYEGQGPMLLEAAAGQQAGDGPALPLCHDAQGILRCDWAPLLPMLCDTTRGVQDRAASFHAAMAGAIVAQATALRREIPIDAIGLTGGVFTNRRLCETTAALLQQAGFAVCQHRHVPAGDGGLAFGQLVEGLARHQQGTRG
ncbi:carbamoyltransferase HypF [Mesobacterium sp. TK19101]|uniref:Carbamoyltransferase HypF n=1 Tax=Mesobacterium hydrothermale TaxID=3111907 RepID=A0ABU6HMX1_9RHOB|nr:carbamoyltransferase HypF [Mesobacterium sp. TK19101]MEC3862778.1 carbamoyltransferase HypF [Mesobacterium sp. TK19101]